MVRKFLKIPQSQLPHFETKGNLFLFNMLGEGGDTNNCGKDLAWYPQTINTLGSLPMLSAMWFCCPFHKIRHNFFVPWTWAQSSDMLWPMKLGPSDNVLVPHTVEPVEPEAGSTSFFSMGWGFPDTSACVEYIYRADVSAVCSEELNPIRPTAKAEFPAKPSLDYLVFCQTINGRDYVISSISISQSLKVVGYIARTDRYNTEKNQWVFWFKNIFDKQLQFKFSYL